MLLGLAAVSPAQDPRGTILGRVVDTSGLAVPNVEVRAINIETRVTAAGRSNEAGNYSIPFLLPGKYEIRTAELAGFKKYLRTGLEVRVGDQVNLNVTLELGQVNESVEVREETPLLETASATLGQVMDQRRIRELPLMGGSPVELMLLTPGVISNRSLTALKSAFSNTEISASGSPSFTNEFQFDGVSNTMAERGQAKEAFRPPVGAVSEFKVQATPYDASVGHGMGAVVTMSSNSGTNQLHGEALYLHANSALNAPTFFQNKAGITRRASERDHRYDFSIGGPVYLPKVYDGRNRTFFFLTYEGNPWIAARSYTATVPTEAWRRGDFSSLLSAGYQLYDPLTTVKEGNDYRRQPFAGNLIPSNRLDKVGQNLVNLYPLPNQPGVGAQQTNNFYSDKPNDERYWAQLTRLDHAFGERHRAFLRLYNGHWNELKNLYFGDISGTHLQRFYRGLAIDEVYTISPTMVLNLRYGITSQDFLESRPTKGYNLASLGFSSNLISLIDSSVATIPYISNGFQTIGFTDTGDGGSTSLTHSVSGTLQRIQNAHQLKIGADYRVYRANENRYPQATAPAFSFDSTYTHGPLTTSASYFGQPLASMLLGIPAGTMQRYGSSALQDQYLGLYFQDDFKVTKRLTLNLGLRYELEAPMTERFNRLVAGFAFDQSNPIEAAARTNYAASANPLPELPLSAFKVLGGLTYVNQNGVGRNPVRGEKNNFLPRFGFAYQLDAKTVLRGGYAIFYDSLGVNALAAIQTGYSISTPMQWSKDNGLTQTGATLADPFPSGLYAPLGSAGGLKTGLGQSVSFYNAGLKNPYSQKWSFSVQRLLPGGWSLTSSYVGSRATRIAVERDFNVTPAKYYSTSPTRDNATIQYLGASFPSPFSGLEPVYGTTMTRASLLRPYPEFGSITGEEPVGYNWFHSMENLVEKRFSRGYTLQFNYTWSKLMEAVSRLNTFDAAVYETIGSFDRTHRIAGSGLWEIPLGRGRHFGSSMHPLLNGVVGGWQLGGVVSVSSGAPLTFGNIIFNGNPDSIELSSSQRSVDRWFNIDAGFNRDSGQQLASNIRTFPMRFSGFRSDAVSRWDFSLVKNFRLSEKATFQFRGDVFNAWNHPSFSAPNLSPTSSAFGAVTSIQNVPRSWQLGAKLKW